MPVLSIPNTFVPFTKIVSAQVNANFTAITTLLNTTKLDDTNIQNAGITPQTKLNIGNGTTGQFLSNNGSAVIWTGNPLTAQFNVVLGSAAQVTAGTATHSTFASVTQATGDRILILPGYVTTENWTITQRIYVTGLGSTSQIDGTVTLASGSSRTTLLNCRVTNHITVNSGVEGIIIPYVLLASGKTFVDNSDVADTNYLIAMQET